MKKNNIIIALLLLITGSTVFSTDTVTPQVQSRIDRITGHISPQTSRSICALQSSPTGSSLEQLKIDTEREAIRQRWLSSIIKNRATLDALLKKEDQLEQAGYYVFYHAHQSSMRLIHYFLRNLYEHETGIALRKDFEFLRWWKHGSHYTNVHEWLDDVQEYIPSIGNQKPFKRGSRNFNDNTPSIAQYIASVNPTVFGNYNWPGECAWNFFLKGHSMTNTTATLLTTLFNHYGLDTNYINQLLELEKQLPSETGDLLQIAIPKLEINNIAYASYEGGVPTPLLYDKQLHALDKDNFDPLRKRYTKSNIILNRIQTDQKNPKGLKKL